MSYFQQKLDRQFASAFDLLSQLKDLTGLVFLQDNSALLLGFYQRSF
jgi:para-aminobenzoate synthetase component 1